MMVNIETPLKYVYELKDINFHIDKYQRGFRWGMREITSLLEDISSFTSTYDSFYCLQPLVVSQKGLNHFELIDGQQRCTTIYLILKYLLQDNFFNIKYETRGTDEGTNLFLASLDEYDFPDFINIKDDLLDDNISDHWKNIFIIKYDVNDCVDNFYFFKAYCIIKRWFSLHFEKIEVFKDNLLNNTKVIWYNEKHNHNGATNTFINFNDGKISLDQAELVKGLFVLDFDTINDATRKSYEENQFAEEWNVIEQHLKVPSFWNFINPEKNNKELANKITILLQLEKGKGLKEEDIYYTYRAYENAFKSVDKPEWRNLSSLYNQLEEWYTNRETYHLMGAVVHLTNTSIHEMVKAYKTKSNKKELSNYLRDILRGEFFDSKTQDFKSSYKIDTLKYGAKGVTPILLLYNIATAHQSDKYYKFPFDLFRNVQSWNIEHIHAKNTNGFETKQDLEEWYKEISEIIEDRADLKINEEVQSLLLKIDFEKLTYSNQIVKQVELKLGEILEKDSLGNLCFLDNLTNIQVGKKVFRKKREMVLEINHELNKEAYIPIATKMIFQKSITPSEDITMNYWNTYDREAYLEDINNRIITFLERV